MPDERNRTAQHTTLPPPDDGLPEQGFYERFIGWAAGLPWWAIILGTVAVVVLYSMLSSAAYRRVIHFLTDKPEVTTDDLFEVVQIVGEPTMIVGHYEGETQDSVDTVIGEFLQSFEGSSVLTRIGFVEDENPAALTVRTLDGTRVTIPKDRIVTEERVEGRDGTQITITYVDRVTVTGVLTERNDDTMTIRTVDEEKETFAASRILSRESELVPCAEDAAPDCEPTEIVTIQREGETVVGKLSTLSNVSVKLTIPGEDEAREIRRTNVDFFYVPTLTVALNAGQQDATISPGDEVRVGFVEGSDITALLDELESLDDVPVPLRYGEGDARVALIAYPDVIAALEATGAGEVDALVYLDSGLDRDAVSEWVDDHPDGGVVVAHTGECAKSCEASVKLVDDVITGRIARETDQEITMVTTEAEFVVLDRSTIVENRRMEPGVCALNNLRGCNAGIFLTLRVTFQAYALALLLGLIFGLMRVQTNPVLVAISTLYVEVIRGIPLLVILLYAGFVVSPRIRDLFGISLNDEQEAVLGLAFGYGAFIAEIFRAGIQSISRGQMEAARSLGMSYPQAMRYVVLPQAIRVVLPPLGNDFIAMLKDSALISVLALPDLLQLGRLYVSRTFRAFEGYNTVAILYLLMTLFLSMLVRVIERRSRLPA
jgi:polar amino acid transport system permease protein